MFFFVWFIVLAQPGRQTHFGAIHSPKFANLLKFYSRAQDVRAIFYDFFLGRRVCPCCKLIQWVQAVPSTLVAFLKAYFNGTLRSKSSDVVYQMPPSSSWGLGSAVSSPRGSWQSRLNDICCILGWKKASDESNFTCIFMKKSTRKFDKRFGLVYVHSNLYVWWKTFKLFTTIFTDPLHVALTRKQLVTDTDTPLEYVSE